MDISKENRHRLIFIIGFLLSIPVAIPLVFTQGTRISFSSLLHLLLLVFFFSIIPVRVKASNLVFQLILLFFMVSAASLFVGTLRYSSANGLYSFAYQMILVSHFIVGWNLLRDKNDILVFFRGMVFGSVGVAFVVIFEIATSASRTDIFELHRIFMAPYDPEGDGARFGFVSGVFGWPNAYGCYSGIVFLISLFLGSLSPRGLSRSSYRLCSGVLLAAVILTFSRTAYIVTGLGLLIWTFRLYGSIRASLLTGSLAAIVTSLILFFPATRGVFLYWETFKVRLLIVYLTIRETGPVEFFLGHGYQNFENITELRSDEMIVPGLSFQSMSTHNEFLTIFLKVGILGLLLFMVILLLLFLKSFMVSRYYKGLEGKIFILWSSVLIPLFMSLFAQENLRYWPIAIVFWMLSGSLMNFMTPDSKQEQNVEAHA